MKSTLLLLTFAFLCFSCSDDDTNPSNLLNNGEEGALIRALNIQNNSISNDTDEGSLEAFLLYTDGEQGTLLDRMDIYVTFLDNSDDADSSSAIFEEVLLRSVEDNEFEIGEDDFPTYQMTISAQDFYNVTNNTSDSVASGDSFFTRLELVLIDGRTFSFLESDQFGPGVANFIFTTTVE